MFLVPLFYRLPKNVSKSFTVIMVLSNSPFSSVSFCFMHFEAMLLGACTFKVTISSWQIGLCISENAPCLSSHIFVDSPVSDICQLPLGSYLH